MGVTQDHWDRRMEEAERLEQIGYRWCSQCRRRLLPDDGETCGPCLGGPPERLVSRGGVIVKERPQPSCAVCHRTLTPEEDDAAITVNLGLRTGSMCARCVDRHYSPPEDLES